MTLIPSLVPKVDIDLEVLVPTERKKAMMSELGRLDEEWKKKTQVVIPEAVTFEKKAEKVIDADQIREDVLAERAHDYEKKTGEITQKSLANQNKKSQQIDDEIEDLKDTEGQLLDEYERSQKELKNDMLDRGLARSSIVKSATQRLKNDTDQEIAKAREYSQDKVTALQMEISILQAQLANELENFKISEGLKVQEKIDEVISKLNSENEKIKEYNDKLTQKEADSAKKRADAILKAEEARVNEAKQDALYGYQGEKAENYYNRLDVAKKYYGSIPKEQALKELKEDKDVRNYLGLYYNKLLAYVYQR